MSQETERSLTPPEVYDVKEAIKAAIIELEELQYSQDWFVSDSLDYLYTALEILGEERIRE